MLTDDVTTIEEVQKYHAKDYNWIYLDRPRNRGIDAGMNGHIPSGDEGFEMLAIETELKVAAMCEKIVCGMSGFMESLVQSMDAENMPYTLHFLDTRVTKKEALKFGGASKKREKSLFQDLWETRKKKEEEEKKEK